MGKYAEALALYEKALRGRQKGLGEEHPSTATGYNNLATCLQVQGKFAQALPMYQKALRIWRKAQGEEHPDAVTGPGPSRGRPDHPALRPAVTGVATQRRRNNDSPRISGGFRFVIAVEA